MQKLRTTIQSVIVGLIVALSAGYAIAWTGPSATPPGNNIEAPINASATGQTKTGALYVGSGNPAVSFRTFAGQAAIGTTSPIVASLRLLVSGKVGAEGYCDMDGLNCTSPAVIASSSSNTSNVVYLRDPGAVDKIVGQMGLPGEATGCSVTPYLKCINIAIPSGDFFNTYTFQWTPTEIEAVPQIAAETREIVGLIFNVESYIAGKGTWYNVRLYPDYYYNSGAGDPRAHSFVTEDTVFVKNGTNALAALPQTTIMRYDPTTPSNPWKMNLYFGTYNQADSVGQVNGSFYVRLVGYVTE